MPNKKAKIYITIEAEFKNSATETQVIREIEFFLEELEGGGTNLGSEFYKINKIRLITK